MNEKDYLRLIAAMVADIHKQIVKDGDVQSDLVASALWNQADWAIHWEHGFLLPDGDTPEAVSFVADVLDMWHLIEHSSQQLSAPDKERLAAEVPYGHGKDPIFPGFDGNSEGEYRTVIRMFTDHMGRYEDFKGRNTNSHAEMAGRYRQMLEVFDPIRAAKTSVGNMMLTADEIIAVLKAPYADH